MSAGKWTRIDKMTDEELQEFIKQPRSCTRCQFEGEYRHFGTTRARGKLLFRSWCPECVRKYHRDRKRERRAKKAKVAA